MTTPPPHTPDDPVREQLVAYLDGELPPKEARQVEDRLRSDEPFRKQLQALERAWNALDELPRSTVDDNFSKTTIEMAAVEAQREVTALTAALPVRRRRRRMGLVLSGLLAAAAAFALVRGVATSGDRAMMRNLPVIWRVDALMQVQDAEFLTMLMADRRHLLDDLSSESTRREAADWTALHDKSFAGRAQRVRALSDVERSRLLTAERQFHWMSDEKQANLHEQYEALFDDPEQDPLTLHAAALAYAAWVATQTPEVQSELRQIESSQERVDRVAQLRGRQQWDARRSLSAEDAAALREAVLRVADRPEVARLPKRMREFARSLDLRDQPNGNRRQAQRMLHRFGDALESQAWLRVALLQQLAFAPDRGRRGERAPPGLDAKEVRRQAREDWEAIEPTLVAALSHEARAALPREPERRADRLRQWVLQSAADALEPGKMEAFFASEKLSDQQRNELLALPRAEMQEQLQRYYAERELGGIDAQTLEDFAPWLKAINGRGRGEEPRRPPPPKP